MPDDAAPLAALLSSGQGAGQLVECHRAFTEPRSHVIAATPALRERELMKGAALSDFLAAALQARGAEATVAALSAEIGWVTFHRASTDCPEDPFWSLEDHLVRVFDDLRALKSCEP